MKTVITEAWRVDSNPVLLLSSRPGACSSPQLSQTTIYPLQLHLSTQLQATPQTIWIQIYKTPILINFVGWIPTQGLIYQKTQFVARKGPKVCPLLSIAT